MSTPAKPAPTTPAAADSTGATGTTPAAAPAPKPKSPGIVAKTPLITPRELELEKQLKGLTTKHALLEDKVGGLEGVIGEMNTFLEGIGARAEGTAPSGGGKAAPAAAKATRRFVDQVHDEIFGPEA